MKRGEISMEVIIIAAIALLVLVILSFLLLRNTDPYTDQCSTVGGTCLDDCSEMPGTIPSVNQCPGEGMRCCVPLGNSDE